MNLGFIGCGNMATAIANGIIEQGLFVPSHMLGYDISDAACASFSEKVGVKTTQNVSEMTTMDVLILAIKPQQFSEFLEHFGKETQPNTLIISIAAGKTLAFLESFFTEKQAIVRVMPNLNAMISRSTSAYALNSNVTLKQSEFIVKLLESFGSATQLDEAQFSTFTAIAGSSPAYFFKLIEAMTKSAASSGISYKTAKSIVIETILGSAEFAKQSPIELPQLIANVTSPNGTTEAALKVLDAQNFDSLIDEAQLACINRDIELGK